MLLNKTLFLLLFPILSSCNVHWCCHLDIEPENCHKSIKKTVQKEHLAAISEEGTEGWPVVDWPFNVNHAA